MTVERKEVGKQRYRESYGRYFEDFAVGDVYEHRPGRTITAITVTVHLILQLSSTFSGVTSGLR